MMCARDKVPEIARAARDLADAFYDYEAAYPKSVRGHSDGCPRWSAPSIAAAKAVELARGLTDWAEGHWNPSEEEIKAFVATKVAEIHAMAEACGIDLGTDD